MTHEGSVDEMPATLNSIGERKDRIIYKVVLTGGRRAFLVAPPPPPSPSLEFFWTSFFFVGPCAGKTTALVRLRTFFESVAWKVVIHNQTLMLKNVTKLIIFAF